MSLPVLAHARFQLDSQPFGDAIRAMTNRMLVAAAFAFVACGRPSTTPTAAPAPAPAPAAPAAPAPKGYEVCFTPEVSRRGGEAPAVPGSPSATQSVPGDQNGCAPFRNVADTCCCSASAGPRFDGKRCCYVITPCGCC